MDIIFAFAGLNRDPSSSRLTAYLLASSPVEPLSGESIWAAKSSIEPAEFTPTDSQTLPTNEAVVVVTGSVVFRSFPAVRTVIEGVGLFVVQNVDPVGIVGIALFDSTFSITFPEQELFAEVLLVGSQSL